MAEERKKDILFKGKTVEELNKMSLEELAQLYPASLRRKIKRGFTEQEQKFLESLRAGQKNIKTHCRDFFVLPEMVGHTISIYNGKEFVSVAIIPEMIAMRLGELAPSRKIATHTGSK